MSLVSGGGGDYLCSFFSGVSSTPQAYILSESFLGSSDFANSLATRIAFLTAFGVDGRDYLQRRLWKKRRFRRIPRRCLFSFGLQGVSCEVAAVLRKKFHQDLFEPRTYGGARLSLAFSTTFPTNAVAEQRPRQMKGRVPRRFRMKFIGIGEYLERFLCEGIALDVLTANESRRYARLLHAEVSWE